MYNNEIWTKHTRLILTGVIIVAIAGWVAGILQTASIAIDTANDLLKAAGEEELPLKPFTLSAQTLTIIGYILYLVGLNGFKSIQKNYEASAMVGRISTACGFEIAATLLLFPASFLPVIFGWLFRFGAFVCTIISLILLKSAFEELREEATWSKPALKGAEQLRKSAVYNINLIWMPFVAAAVIVVSILLFTKGIDFNNLMYTGFDEISRQIKGTVFAVGLEVLAFGLIMLYWSVMQFVLRILGWVNIHAGRLVEETNAQDENSTATASFTPEAQTDTSLYTSHTNTPDTETAFPNPALHKGTSSSFTVVSLWPSSLQQFAWLSVVLPLRTNSRVHGDSTTNPKPPNSSSTSKAIPQKAHSISAAKKRWGSSLSVSTWPLSRWRAIRPSSN